MVIIQYQTTAFPIIDSPLFSTYVLYKKGTALELVGVAMSLMLIASFET